MGSVADENFASGRDVNLVLSEHGIDTESYFNDLYLDKSLGSFDALKKCLTELWSWRRVHEFGARELGPRGREGEWPGFG